MTRRSLAFDIVIGAAVFVILALVPLVFPSKALIDFVIRFSAYALFATSLNFLVGYGGMVSFGHGMFFGLGAYAFALLMQRTGMPIPAAFAITLVMCAAVGLVIGAICVRLKEIYFAFLTLAFQMMLYSLIILWVPLTGGDQGLRGGIPRPPFLGINLANQTHLYLVSCTLMIIGMILMHHLLQSPFGYTLRMIRDNAARANFLGIAVFRVRLLAFVMAGIFAGAGGVIMSLFVSGAYPEFAYWTISGEGIFIIMLGGLNTFLGPAVGTVILLVLNDVVTRHTEYYGLTLGIIILVFALGLRRGLLDVLVDLWHRRAALSAAGVKTGPRRLYDGGRRLMLAVEGILQVVWRRRGDAKRHARLRGGLADRHHRPKRRRQDDLFQLDLGGDAAGPRQRQARRRGYRRLVADADRPPRHGARVPDRQHLSVADGRGDPDRDGASAYWTGRTHHPAFSAAAMPRPRLRGDADARPHR